MDLQRTWMRFARAIGLAMLLCWVAMAPGAAGELGVRAPAADRAAVGPAVPPLPFSPYGTVKVMGANVEPGTLVRGWCAGALWDTYAAVLDSGETWYSLEIPADDPETGEVEGCSAGETVTFTIGELPALQSAVWVAGGAPRVDLTTPIGKVCLALVLRRWPGR